MRSCLAELVGHLPAHVLTASPDSDAALLGRYATDRDGEAFAELVHRHGPMVFGVCRRVLADTHAAEDAYEVAFLALARHATTVRHPTTLAGWLHRVARHAAIRLRAARCPVPLATKLDTSAHSDPLAALAMGELLAALDDAICELPDRYRSAVVLCHLEGCTVDEAARRLGTTNGAVRGWLVRGRSWLAERLTTRGLSLPAALAGWLRPELSPRSCPRRRTQITCARQQTPLPLQLGGPGRAGG